jgi:hypothetical protein
MRYHHPSFVRTVALATIVAFVCVAIVPVWTSAQTGAGATDEVIARRFEQVMVLKSRGEFDQAIGELTAMIGDYEDSEQVLRLAYSYLVATYHEKGDTDGARRAATEALERYPDISAQDVITVPPSVDTYYETLRREMFGALHIVEPKGALVFLNEKPAGEGETPLRLALVRVGEYDLLLSKPGYYDYSERIAIQPDDNLVKTIQMKRARDKKWWGIRIGAAAVAGLVAYLLIKDGESDPLPPPPELPE